MLNLPPIDISDRRRADRRSALDVHICLVDLGQGRSAMLLDVSETGIGLQTVEGPAEGLSASFRFTLPDTDVAIAGDAELAWADRAGRMGLRFTNLAPEMREDIRKWVHSEANPLFSDAPVTDEIADLDARDRVAQMEARIIVSGWAQLQAINFLVDQIAAMTQASGVAIAFDDGDGITCKASSGIAPQVGVRVDPRSGLSGECVRTSDIVQCVDTETDPRVDRIVCRQLNMRSAMLVPVMKNGRVAGLIEVFSSRAHAFSNQTAVLLRRIADAVASLDETAPKSSETPESPVVQSERPTSSSAQAAPAAPSLTSVPHRPIPVSDPAIPVQTRTPAASVAPVVAPTASSAAAAVKPAVAPAPVAPKVVEPQHVPLAEKPIATPQRLAIVEKPSTVVDTPRPKDAERPAASIPTATKSPDTPLAPAATKPVVEPVAKTAVAPKAAKPASVSAPPVSSAAKSPVVKPDVTIAAPKPVAKAEPKLSPKPVQVPAAKPVEMSSPRPAASEAASGVAPAPTAARTFELPDSVVDTDRFQPADDADVVAAPERNANVMRVGIAAGVVVLVTGIGVGGWYLARPRVVYQDTAKAAAVKTDVPAAALPSAPTPTSTAAGATTNSSVIARDTTTTAATASKTASGNSGSKSSASAASDNESETSGPIAATPIMMASAGRRNSEVAAPPMAIAPPNTLGVASILANPVPAPALSTQKVSQGVTGGKQVTRIQPVYPQAARSMHVSGTVLMRAHVSKSGLVTQVQVLKGHPMLNAAALDAVRRWKYQPFMLNGQAIENDINVEIRFDLPQQ